MAFRKSKRKTPSPPSKPSPPTREVEDLTGTEDGDDDIANIRVWDDRDDKSKSRLLVLYTNRSGPDPRTSMYAIEASNVTDLEWTAIRWLKNCYDYPFHSEECESEDTDEHFRSVQTLKSLIARCVCLSAKDLCGLSVSHVTEFVEYDSIPIIK